MYGFYALAANGSHPVLISSTHADLDIVKCWLDKFARELQETYPGYKYDWSADRETLIVTRPSGKRTSYYVQSEN